MSIEYPFLSSVVSFRKRVLALLRRRDNIHKFVQSELKGCVIEFYNKWIYLGKYIAGNH
jgi:hypothetical protein